MSLSLIQSYSSAEEDEREEFNHHHHNFSENEDDDTDPENNDAVSHFPSTYNPVIAPNSSHISALPSALDAFSEISGPPQFLNNCAEDQSLRRENVVVHRGRKKSRDKKDLPAGAVVEAKPNLVGIHERVRSDIEGKASSTASTQPPKTPAATTTDDASQPRMCLQCGIPKTYSSALGMVCPVCPPDDSKKKGSTVKDKEKVKRMRGQSSHATWKTETEMHLRQQFD
ncbi:hypothetical protein BVRB_9g214850 [Beta vulgaris subsp. vulgaris]|nr:hypothetical protein BVRB_9g214850 [Beta vulgaris subsp. vulgaris]